MAGVEVREVTTTYGETTPSGETTRDDRSWQLGAVVDDVWVPFATVNQGQYDHFKQRQDAAQASSSSSAEQGTTTNTGKATKSS